MRDWTDKVTFRLTLFGPSTKVAFSPGGIRPRYLGGIMSSPTSERPKADGPSNTPGKRAGRSRGPRILLWLAIVLTVALMAPGIG